MTTPFKPITRQPKRIIRVWPMVVSLLATLAISIVVANHYAPDIKRYVELRKLHSDNKAVQREGFNYVTAHAHNPKLQAACCALFEENNPELSQQLIRALRKGGAWNVHFGKPWLDEIVRRYKGYKNSPTGRAMLAVELGESAWTNAGLVYTSAYDELIKRLLNDEKPVVRLQALRAAAAMSGHCPEILHYATADNNATIARNAWVMLKLANGATEEINLQALQQAPPLVQPAMLYACPSLIESSLKVPGVDSHIESYLPWFLRNNTQIDQKQWYDYQGENALSIFTQWRAMLYVPLTDQVRDDLKNYIKQADSNGDKEDVLIAAAISRLQGWPPNWPAWSSQKNRYWRELARLESLPIASMNFSINQDWPYLPLIAAVRASKAATPDDLMPAFNANLPEARHLAVLAALDRFDETQINELIEKLVTSFWEYHRISGCLLAALHHSHADFLTQRLADEKQWHIQQHIHLALLMLGQNNTYRDKLPGLMIRKDIARSFIYITMLNVGDKTALDQLFTPFGNDSGQLRTLLDQQRFHVFLKKHLPGMPPFSTWADPQLQQFQVDVIRNWYLMNRPNIHFNQTKKQFRIVGSALAEHSSRREMTPSPL